MNSEIIVVLVALAIGYILLAFNLPAGVFLYLITPLFAFVLLGLYLYHHNATTRFEEEQQRKAKRAPLETFYNEVRSVPEVDTEALLKELTTFVIDVSPGPALNIQEAFLNGARKIVEDRCPPLRPLPADVTEIDPDLRAHYLHHIAQRDKPDLLTELRNAYYAFVKRLPKPLLLTRAQLKQSPIFTARFDSFLATDTTAEAVSFLNRLGGPMATAHPPGYNSLRDWSANKLDFSYNAYLGLLRSPFQELATLHAPIFIPQNFEHCYILSQSGHGKTTLIEHIISRRLEEDCCIIVIDSQRQLIPKLAQLDIPTDQLGWITPHHPLSLNLFSFERSHTATELLTFVLAGLMDAALTAKQTNVFNFAIQLLLVTPGANIRTFLDLLDEKADLGEHVSKLDSFSQEFFAKEFNDPRQYRDTKQEIRWRLWTLLNHPIFREMFASTENRISMRQEMNRRLVLIDTDSDLLQKSGSQFFGRMFVATILQEAQRRFQGNHRPVYLIIDEAQELIDQNIARLLAQARKAKIDVTLSHHYIGQEQTKDPEIATAILTNTAVKITGNLNQSDVRRLAAEMHTTPEMIDENRKQKGRFALYVKGVTDSAITINVPPDPLHDLPKTNNPEAVKPEMIRRYYALPSEPPSNVEPPPEPSNPRDIDNIDI